MAHPSPTHITGNHRITERPLLRLDKLKRGIPTRWFWRAFTHNRKVLVENIIKGRYRYIKKLRKVKDLPFCSECGAEVDEEDKFCRNCGKQLRPEAKVKQASATELAKIAAIQEQNKDYRHVAYALIITGGIVLFCVTLILQFQKALAGASISHGIEYSILIGILSYVPFFIIAIFFGHRKDRLEKKLEKGELA